MFGIDLGTTHTLAATISAAGHSELLALEDGKTLLPSAVLFADDRTVVGTEAQLRGRTNPDRFAACVKRSMGRAHYEHSIGGSLLPPEVIQACILRRVRRLLPQLADARSHLVIAVPVHFSETQRRATAFAAELAGLPLLDLVHEPLAAALAFAEDAPQFQFGDGHEPVHDLVFDLGGYTFEATILAISPGEMKMIASEQDPNLGGHDWDLRLAELLARPWARELQSDPRQDPRQLELFMTRAVLAKHALTDRARFSVHSEFRGQSLTCSVTRAEFESASADLLARIEQLCTKLLFRAGLSWSNLRHVLLVGGATRMPMIRQFVAERLGREPDCRVAPEEAVARGAAIYAQQILQHRQQPPALQVISCSTHSLGIEGVDQATGKHVNKVLIPRGSPLPARVTREFPGMGHSGHAIVFQVLEGEASDPAQCLRIGQVVLSDLPADFAEHWPIDVTYEYSLSGQLTVTAKLRYSDHAVRLTTHRPAGVSRTHLEAWREVVAAEAGFDAYRRVLSWEQAGAEAPPVIIAGRTTSTADADSAEESDAIHAFLRRWMPFLFPRS